MNFASLVERSQEDEDWFFLHIGEGAGRDVMTQVWEILEKIPELRPRGKPQQLTPGHWRIKLMGPSETINKLRRRLFFGKSRIYDVSIHDFRKVL